MQFKSVIALFFVAIGTTAAQSGGVGGVGLPAPTFLQGLDVSDISDFLSIVNNANLTKDEIISDLTAWAGQLPGELQSEVGQWTANLTDSVQQVLSELGTVVEKLSPAAQSLFDTVSGILTNDSLNGNDQCANVLKVFGSAPTNVLSELFTAAPLLGNLCGLPVIGTLLGGLIGALVADLLGLVGGIVGGLLGGLGLGGAVSGVVGSLGSVVSSVVGGLGNK
uniref:ANIS5_cation-bd domain-containing protein n=1 Tax=Panagrellus redivivus TaxID=6233 RepID=A0A7E4ZQQ5_PANRE